MEFILGFITGAVTIHAIELIKVYKEYRHIYSECIKNETKED